MAKERERKAKLAKEKKAKKRKHSRQQSKETREQRELELLAAAGAAAVSSDSEFDDDDGDPEAVAQRREHRKLRREAARRNELPDRTVSFNLTLTVSESDWLQAHSDLQRLCEFAQGDGRGRVTAPCIELLLLHASKRLDNFGSWGELEQAAAADPSVMLVDDPLDGVAGMMMARVGGEEELDNRALDSPAAAGGIAGSPEVVEPEQPQKQRRRAGRLQRKLHGLQRKRAQLVAEQAPEPQLSEVDQQEQARVEAIWNTVDVDQSGFLDEQEVRTVMRDMDVEMGAGKFAQVMAEIDKDQSGELDFNEFLGWWQRQDPEAQKQLEILRGLQVDEL